MAKRQNEGKLKKKIKDYLSLNNWFVFHVQQGMYSYKGISDLVAIKNGQTVFIEVKFGRGKQTGNQKYFEAEVKSAGAKYIVVWSLGDLEFYLSEEGLL
jgi:hypothetical protein